MKPGQDGPFLPRGPFIPSFWILQHGVSIFMWSVSNLLAGNSCRIKRTKNELKGKLVCGFSLKACLEEQQAIPYLKWMQRCDSVVVKMILGRSGSRRPKKCSEYTVARISTVRQARPPKGTHPCSGYTGSPASPRGANKEIIMETVLALWKRKDFPGQWFFSSSSFQWWPPLVKN